jgi:hypothetical protein
MKKIKFKDMTVENMLLLGREISKQLNINNGFGEQVWFEDNIIAYIYEISDNNGTYKFSMYDDDAYDIDYIPDEIPGEDYCSSWFSDDIDEVMLEVFNEGN